MKALVSFVALAVAVMAAPNRDSEFDLVGAQTLRAYPEEASQMHYLQGIFKTDRFDFWTEPRRLNVPIDIMATRWNLPMLKAILHQQGIAYQVLIADVGKQVEEAKANRKSGPVDWTNYHTYSEIDTWMHELSQQHSDLVSLKNIGSSYEGRTMNMLTISSGGSGKPGILVDGGIHAREWISPAVVTYFINEIATNPNDYKHITDKVDLHFIPSINPDGYAYTWESSRFWRKTRSRNPGSICYGADPNRNWEFHWMEVGASDNPCSDIYGGSKPFSEIEMANVRDQMLAMRDSLKVYLTFHSYSQLWMYPWGFTSALPSDWKDLDDLAQNSVDALTAVHGTRYEIGSSTNTIYAAAGGSDDYAKGTAGIKYAYTIELRDTGHYGFELPPKLIQPTSEETFEGFKVVMDFVATTYGK